MAAPGQTGSIHNYAADSKALKARNWSASKVAMEEEWLRSQRSTVEDVRSWQGHLPYVTLSLLVYSILFI